MWFKKILISLLALLIFDETLAQDIFIKKNLFSRYEPAIEKNQIISERNTIGEYPILKIGAEQKAVLLKVNYSTGTSVPLGRVVMFSQRDKKFLALLDITGNLNQTSSSDWTDTPCKRDNFLWKRSIGGEFANVNCVSINHVVTYFLTSTGEFQQIAVWAKDEGIEIPPTIIRITFTRYSSGGKRLEYIVDVNPEQYGVKRELTDAWGSNEWYKDFIKRDSRKVEFIDRLKNWASDVQDRMDLAFKKDARAFSDMKSLDFYLTVPIAVTNTIEVKKSDGTDQVEDRLLKIKNLFEKGLLTENQYNDQVKIILHGN